MLQPFMIVLLCSVAKDVEYCGQIFICEHVRRTVAEKLQARNRYMHVKIDPLSASTTLFSIY